MARERAGVAIPSLVQKELPKTYHMFMAIVGMLPPFRKD